MASGTPLPIREWMQPIEDADLFGRAVGGVDGGPVLVLAHGGPGLSHDYLGGIIPRSLPEDPVEWLGAVIPAFFSDPRRPGLADSLIGTTYSPAAGGAVLQALGGYDYDLRPLLSRLTMPVLNVICDVPHGIENGLALAEALPPGNADRLVLTGQGHLPWIECPDLFYPAVRAFMGSSPGRRSARRSSRC